MKLLPHTFNKRRFNYKLERRLGIAAIYRQQWNGISNASIAYEVIIPQVSKRRIINGEWQECEPYETYPSTNSWGIKGWTFTDLDQAVAKMASLSSAGNHRNRFDELDGTRQRKSI